VAMPSNTINSPMITRKAPISMESSPISITISPIGVLGPHGPAPGTKLRITASIPHPPVISPLLQSFTNSLYHGFVTDGSNLQFESECRVNFETGTELL